MAWRRLTKFPQPHRSTLLAEARRDKKKKALLSAPLVVLLGLACLVSCAPAQPVGVPRQADDGWRTGSLDAVGINPKKLSC